MKTGDLKWYDNPENTLHLAEQLVEQDRLQGEREVLRFFEKPWKWEPEWEALQLLGGQFPEELDIRCPECGHVESVAVYAYDFGRRECCGECEVRSVFEIVGAHHEEGSTPFPPVPERSKR